MAGEVLLEIPPGELVPYARNSRLHSEEQIAQLMASIREFGFTNPMLVDEQRLILAGHGRQVAAQRLGMATVPCRQLVGLSAAQKQAYVIADNRLALSASWDDQMLQLELADLRTKDFDLELLGFDAKELELALAFGQPTDVVEDPIPEPPADPVCQPGDLWILGRHRLFCGDSTAAEAVATCLGGAEPFMMVTDPPYGVDYDPKWRLDSGLNKEHQTRAEGVVVNDDNASWLEAWRLFPGTVAYVWHGALHASVVANDLVEAGFEIRSQIMWSKPSLVIGRGAYHWQHEPCWYAARGTAKWVGDRKQSTVWNIPNMHRTQGDVDDGKTAHSTQKPVECMARPMRNHGTAGDAIYDPFLGSGTTLIAAEQLGRTCYGLEISPAYCDLIIARWEALTGQKAERGEV